jgi:3-deoxy-D-manno-octulosonic acid kinase
MRPANRGGPASRAPRYHYPEPGGAFRRLAIGRRVIYLRNDLIDKAAAIISAIDHPELLSPAASTVSAAGNRGGGYRLSLPAGPEVFIRYARRGGLMRFIASDWYAGMAPRPFRELAVAVEAGRRGIAIAEPLGAIVQRLLPGIYRGAFLTRALQGMTLWQFVQTDDDPQVRMHVAAQVRQVIDFAHQMGLFHADLNLHNIFVTTAGESFSIALLDLDKARIYAEALAPPLRMDNLDRLRRSIGKLDPGGRYFTQSMITTLTGR